LLLFLRTGYGYRPIRLLFWYLALVFGFAALYLSSGEVPDLHSSFGAALVFSITAFHGRGFFPDNYDSFHSLLSLIEALIGLFLEMKLLPVLIRRPGKM
jgi:hypothetical protein